jgi:hypothetical protein
MANSRIISAADLVTADFDDVADDWAVRRGLGGNSNTKLNATVVGVAPDANDLGTGWSGIVSDGSDVKAALLALEANLSSNQLQTALTLITAMQLQIDALMSVFTTKPIEVSVSTTTTGVVYTFTAPIAAPLTWSKISGDANITIDTTGLVSIGTPIADDVTQTAVVRAQGENSALEFSISITGTLVIPADALYSAIDNSVLTSAIDGSILTSAL